MGGWFCGLGPQRRVIVVRNRRQIPGSPRGEQKSAGQ